MNKVMVPAKINASSFWMVAAFYKSFCLEVTTFALKLM